MKKNFYLQHPLMAMNDPRMQRMINIESLKGSGAYWVIIEKLALLPEPRATFEYLRPFCNKKIPFSYLKKIILEYQLFTLEEDGYFMPTELNPIHKKEKKTVENGTKDGVKTDKNNLNSDINAPKNVEKESETAEIEPENMPGNTHKALNINPTNPNRHAKKEENIKDNTITSAAALEERRKPPYAAADEYGNFHPLHPVVPWQKSLEHLSEDSSYIELAYMHCGYGELLKRRFKDAIEYFKRHIILYHKQDNLPNRYEVYRYFANFTAPGVRTSTELRNYLTQLDEAEQLKHPDAYRFEKLIDGKRTYNGCPLPDEAPPRPDARSLWNDTTGKWVSPKPGASNAQTGS